MKKPAPTLIDTVYRASFRNETVSGWKSNGEMRRVLEGASRFVATEPMAAFMAELANEAFLSGKAYGQPLALRICDSLRVQARLPHEAIWIEYPLRAYQARSHELRGEPPIVPEDIPGREGWLIQQHPGIESAHIMHLFTQADPITESLDGFSAWTFPFAFAWCTDDSPLPWRATVSDTAIDGKGSKVYASSYLSGIAGYLRDNVGFVRSPLVNDPQQRYSEVYGELIREWTGVLRRVWALLATIDNLPLSYGQVRQSKGFLARGRIRKYLSHSTITLNIPARKDSRVVARQAIALAHRKRHRVRAHWREDWRYPPSAACEPHLWDFREDADHIECSACHGRMTFIHKHERGDAALGYVTHDYALKHEEQAS